MRKPIRLLLGCVTALFFLTGTAFGGDYTWNGGAGSWDDAANWTPMVGSPPGPGDTARVDSGTATIVDKTTVGAVNLTGSGVLDAAAAFDLVILGDAILDGGGVTPNVRIVMEASTGPATLTANSPLPFLTITAAAGPVRLGSPLHVSTELHLAGGVLESAGFPIEMAGNWSVSGGTFKPGAGEVRFIGPACGVGSSAFNVLTVEPSGAVTLTGNITVGGDLNINDGTLDLKGYGISVGGNWNRSPAAAFTHGGGRVKFIGTGASRIMESNTFFDFRCSAPGKELLFEPGKIQVIQGSLTIVGDSGNDVMLHSGVLSAQWIIDNAGGSENVLYASVRDSLVAGVNDITASFSTDEGNNEMDAPGWRFVGPPTVVASPGANSPVERTITKRDARIEILQVAVQALNEGAVLDSVRATGAGSGDDSGDIKAVNIVHDVNGNGIHDVGDILRGTAAFDGDDGAIVFDRDGAGLNIAIPKDSTTHLLITYDLDVDALSGAPAIGVPFPRGRGGAAAFGLLGVLLAAALVSRRRAGPLRALLAVLLLGAAVSGCVIRPLEPVEFRLEVESITGRGQISNVAVQVEGLSVESAKLFVDILGPEGFF